MIASDVLLGFTFCGLSTKIVKCDAPLIYKIGFTHDPMRRMLHGYCL